MMLMMMADEPMAEDSTVVTNVREIRDANGDLTVITTTTTTTGDVETVDVMTEYFLADGTQVDELPTPEEETTTPDEEESTPDEETTEGEAVEPVVDEEETTTTTT